MKKVLSIVAAILVAVSANAQSYRGFFDLNVGFGASSGMKYPSSEFSTIPESKVSNVLGLSTSHGVQALPFLYAGVGVGLYMPFYNGTDSSYSEVESNTEMNGLSIPIFAHLRWDLNIRKKITPFVGLKIGYQVGLVIDEGPVSATSVYTGNENTSYSYIESYLTPKNGLYFEPSVGIRIRKGDHSGFNISLSYNPTVCTKCEATNGHLMEFSSKKEYIEKKNFGAILLGVGMDF